MSKVRTVFERNKVLGLLAAELETLEQRPASAFLDNLVLLDERIRERKADFPWEKIATQLAVNRWRLYHWYFETFERSISQQMDREDVLTMRGLLQQALDDKQPLDKQFQQYVKSKLTKEYHRSTFSIAFNNAKRQVMRAMEPNQAQETRRALRTMREPRADERAQEAAFQNTITGSLLDIFPGVAEAPRPRARPQEKKEPPKNSSILMDLLTNYEQTKDHQKAMMHFQMGEFQEFMPFDE